MEPAACGLASGVAPYHFILEGRAQLQLPAGEALLLEAGDLVVLTRGAAHDLFIAPASHPGQARLGERRRSR
jgi:AraC family transcriptional activator of mtrCDE